MTNALLAQANKSVKDNKLKDQTADTGSFDYEPPAAGPTAARFVGYVEIGKRPQKEYQGKAKSDCMEAFLFFELLSKKHAKEVGEGDDKRIIYPVHRERVQVKAGDRANFVKLLKKMAYGRDIQHMALMLGEAFLVKGVHNVSGEGDKKKTYYNIRTKEDGYLVGAPVYNANKDPLGDEDMQPLPVPEPTQPIKLLLWDDPTVEQWQSIFIDGTRTVKEKDADGNEVEVEKSKNWMQEDIIENATDFEGSALQALLMEQGGMVLDGGEGVSKEAAHGAAQADADGPDVLDDDPAPEPEKPAEKTAQQAAEPAADDDPLADLGLDL